MGQERTTDYRCHLGPCFSSFCLVSIAICFCLALCTFPSSSFDLTSRHPFSTIALLTALLTALLSSPSPFLETLCDYLTDSLRPRILHEPSLQTLTQVCTVVEALMVLSTEYVDSDDEEDGGDARQDGRHHHAQHALHAQHAQHAQNLYDHSPTSGPAPLPRTDTDSHNDYRSTSRRKAEGGLHVASLLRPVLQDAQTRLVFRAQAVIASEVGRYVPKEGDLDYPGKIERGEWRSVVESSGE